MEIPKKIAKETPKKYLETSEEDFVKNYKTKNTLKKIPEDFPRKAPK